MEDNYDFSGAERGKFFSKDAILVPPVHLESDVLTYLVAHAQARGASLNEVVNNLLRAEIAVLEATD